MFKCYTSALFYMNYSVMIEFIEPDYNQNFFDKYTAIRFLLS